MSSVYEIGKNVIWKQPMEEPRGRSRRTNTKRDVQGLLEADCESVPRGGKEDRRFLKGSRGIEEFFHTTIMTHTVCNEHSQLHCCYNQAFVSSLGFHFQAVLGLRTPLWDSAIPILKEKASNILFPISPHPLISLSTPLKTLTFNKGGHFLIFTGNTKTLQSV